MITIYQYKRPFGVRIEHHVEVGEEMQEKFDQLTADGLEANYEFMGHGKFSICLSDDEFDYRIELVEGKEVESTMVKSIMEYDSEHYHNTRSKWLGV